MFTVCYELNIVHMFQVEKLSVVINLCGITVLVWDYGTMAVGGESSWAIYVSQTTKTNTLSSAERTFVFFPLASVRYWLRALCEVLKEKRAPNYVTSWK
jgi:hypothetical protein